MSAPFAWDLPSDELEVRDFQLSWRMDAPEGAVATATTRVHEAEAAVLIARLRGERGRAGFAVGLKPVEWNLTRALPALDHPALEGFSFDRIALVVADQEVRAGSSELGEAALDFYRRVYGTDEFELVLTPGVNLIGSLPVERLGPEHVLRRLFERLGIEAGVILLQGTLGRSLMSLGKGGGGLSAIRDLYLRALLPKMRPPESPAWFRSGQLGLELTGQPSVGFIGEITVDIEGDVLTFLVKAKIEKDGAGVAVALVGGLRAEEPWVHPFDLQWLIFYKTILKLSVDVKGNIGLGFAARMIVGEKDIDVAAAVKVNASGAITNFLFDGQSAEGISMADLVALQAGMQQGRSLLPGQPPPPAIPLDQLPPMEIKDLHLKFALKNDSDLEVKRGFALKGELFVQMRPGHAMTNFAGVDFSLDDSGIVAKAHLGAYALGPIAWDDALLDLELTMARQNLTISGTADLTIARQHLDVSLTREGAFFEADTTLFDRFRARLAGKAPFTRQEPVWRVRGEMDNDFNGELANLALGRLRTWAEDHERAVAAARAAHEAAREKAAAAARHLEDLEANLSERQAQAKNAMESAARARDAAERAEDRAAAALHKAEQDLEATPARNVRQRTDRRAAVAKARADLAARKAAAAARRADGEAKQAAYAALTSDAVEAARRAAAEARAAAQAAERRLEEAEQLVTRIREGNGTPLVIDRARFEGRLDALRGGTVDLDLDVRLLDRPRHLAFQCGFERLEDGALELVNALLGR